MPRYVRNTVVLAKVETTPGTDIVPTGASDAMLVGGDIAITPLDAQNIDLDRFVGYFGASPQLVGPASVKATIGIELAGSGTANTAPVWNDMMLSAAMAEAVLTVPNRVEYTPISTSLKTISVYYYDDGVLHKLLGAMSNCKLSVRAGKAPRMVFDVIGIDGGISAATNATPTFTGYRMPVPVTKANVVDVSFGATYSAGVITAGTAYPSLGFDIDFGNDVNYFYNLTSDRADIYNRRMTGKITLELTAAQEVTLMASVKANTLTGMGFTLGTTTGNKFLVHAPQVQLLNPTKSSQGGARTIDYDLLFNPSSGNDELRLVQV